MCTILESTCCMFLVMSPKLFHQDIFLNILQQWICSTHFCENRFAANDHTFDFNHANLHHHSLTQSAMLHPLHLPDFQSDYISASVIHTAHKIWVISAPFLCPACVCLVATIDGVCHLLLVYLVASNVCLARRMCSRHETVSRVSQAHGKKDTIVHAHSHSSFN